MATPNQLTITQDLTAELALVRALIALRGNPPLTQKDLEAAATVRA